MIDKTYLQDLLAILKLHNVTHVKMQGLELSFAITSNSTQTASSNDSFQNIADTLKKQEESMPPDIRADSLMDYDKIINWSSPDHAHDELPLPLTGEQDL